VTRREFIVKSGAVTALAPLTVPLVLEACAPTSIPIIPQSPPEPPGPDGRIPLDVADLSSANPIKAFPGVSGSDQMPVIATLVSAGTYKAMSSQCTHQSCQVNSTLTNGFILCQCHLSHFALDGSVLQGPASTPLKSYDAVYDAANKQLRIILT
jgi:cytochrome b6-f complex iron-sulfur subunit